MYLQLLEQGIRYGVLYIHLPGGQLHRFGTHGPEAHWHVKNEAVIGKIAKDWEWQLGETYMNGDWDVADCDLGDLLFILRANFSTPETSKLLQPFFRLLQQWNRISRSYKNVKRHYDFDEQFFRLFLDEDMHYSCAYFTSEEQSLEQAQQEKCRHIANKLLIGPGQKVLDVGCGWGSLACYLAQQADVEVVGITLSQEQLQVAKRRAEERAVNNVSFHLQDYREHDGQYDRIVSVGMFEHVGRPYHLTYFQCLKNLLCDDGVAHVHTIGRSGPPRVTNPWIQQYIFPGGSIPALSEIAQATERTNLLLTDVEVLRLHYATTLNIWRRRFRNHRAQICASKGERFCRMWEFYLTICEVAFRCSDLVVFQLQLAKKHGVVPITRDYLHGSQQAFETLGDKLSACNEV